MADYLNQAQEEWYQAQSGNYSTSMTTLGAKIAGGETSNEYSARADDWIRERSASLADRDWQAAREDSAMQRKVADFIKAGYSPLAALESATGGQSAASAVVPRSNSSREHGAISLLPLISLAAAFARIGAIAAAPSSGGGSFLASKALDVAKKAVSPSNRLSHRYGAYSTPKAVDRSIPSKRELEAALKRAFPD